ncbi:MAG TPA: FeoA family protein [Usitatibacter sp.]|nr:FeoA family protein [Usitatibacter sp.]
MRRVEVLSLCELAAGSSAVVRALGGGADFTRRVSAMGLAAGAPVDVLQNTGRGPLLVRVRDTRIALGRGEAAKVLVEPCP